MKRITGSSKTLAAGANLLKAALVGAAVLLASLPASADMMQYTFYKITDNGNEDISSQLLVTVYTYDEANALFGGNANYFYTDLGDPLDPLDDVYHDGSDMLSSTQYFFTFQNIGPIDSSIAEIYIDDGLLGPSYVVNSLGGYTDFTSPIVIPEELPGANLADPDFEASDYLGADVDNGGPAKGIDQDEDILGLVLGAGVFSTFDLLVAAIEGGDVRFGLHVRSIGVEGGSDSYISPPNPPPPPPPPPPPDPPPPPGVPVPGTLLLLGLGLLLLAARTRRALA